MCRVKILALVRRSELGVAFGDVQRNGSARAVELGISLQIDEIQNGRKGLKV